MKEKYIIYFISKTMKKMNSFIDFKLKEHNIDDLVPSYVNILTAIYLNDGQMKMNEISKQVSKDKSTITVLVNRLIERDYLVKEKSKLDKRVAYISLTEKSMKLENLFREISDEVRSVAYEGFTESEKETFISLLNRINENFDKRL